MTTEADIEALRRADAAFFQALIDRDISALETPLAEDSRRPTNWVLEWDLARIRLGV